MIRIIALIVCSILFTSCSSYKIISQRETSEFIKDPQVNRIDPGWACERKKTRMNGYLRYAITPVSGFTYKDSSQQTEKNYYGADTRSTYYYRGKAFEPVISGGGEITHNITDNFGIGGQFDIAHYYYKHDTVQTFGEYNDDYLGFYQAGFHFRFTKTNGIVTTGYRPEWSFGKFNGRRTIIKEYLQGRDTVVYDIVENNKPFTHLHFTFCHSLFCRIDPVEQFGIFAGLQHKIDPYKAFENRRIVHHSFNFYTGAGLEIASLLSITPWFSAPLFKEATYPAAPCSIGLTAGLIF